MERTLANISPDLSVENNRVPGRAAITTLAIGGTSLALMAVHLTSSHMLGLLLLPSVLLWTAMLPPKVGWWFWVATTFVQGETVFTGGPSWNATGYVALVGALGGWMLSRLYFGATEGAQLGESRFSPGYLYILLVAAGYFCWTALQGWGVNSSEALGSMRRVVMFFGATLFGVALFAGEGERGRCHFAWGMALLGGAMGALGLLEFLLRRDLLVQGIDTAAGLFRVNGVAPNPIVYAFHLAWSLPFGLYLLATARRWQVALISATLVGAMTGAAVLTLNRQTLVVLVAMYAVAFLLMRGRWLPWLWALAFVAALAVTPKLAPKVIQRFALLGDLHQDTSFKFRRDNFRIGVEIVKAHPATGVGLGQYPYVWLDYRPENLYYLHYVSKRRLFYLDFGYMQIATETGLIGLTLFLTLLIAGAAVALRHYAGNIIAHKEAANWWAAILLLILMLALISFIQDTLLRPRVWLTFVLIATSGGSFVFNKTKEQINP